MLERIQQKNNSKKGMPTNTTGTAGSTVSVGTTHNASYSNTVIANAAYAAGNAAGQVLYNNGTVGTTYTNAQPGFGAAFGYTMSGTTMAYKSPSTVLSLYGTNNKELVKIEKDGTVKWAEDATVDEAATAFAKTLAMGVERSAGITYGVKQRMRDAVFEEMISMAKEKGSLTSDDLTYLWQAAKIMDKLKGATE
jgi:hypothetical protein